MKKIDISMKSRQIITGLASRMIRAILVLLHGAMLLMGCSTGGHDVFIEAESFAQKGGWVVDQQFIAQIGSPYLMAHGMGNAVDDAHTRVEMPAVGVYDVYVRTYNWTSPWYDGAGPGTFQLSIDGMPLPAILGDQGDTWTWQHAGKVEVKNNSIILGLQDMTGFNGRVDAIYMTTTGIPPPDDASQLALFRKGKIHGDKEPLQAVTFDLVVIGGGIAGTAAAISAARLGLDVALIQDRPVLGGNNSSEVRVHLGGRIFLDPFPALGAVVNEIGPLRGGNARPADYYEDDKKLEAVLAEENISLFLNYRAHEVRMDGNKITEVMASHIETAENRTFRAPLFVDCTGDGTIGFLAGADYVMGREGRNEYHEPTAPDEADRMTMGSSVQWYSVESENEQSFPAFSFGVEFTEESARKVTMGEWTWETGMNLDQINDFERIRDYGLQVVFSNWSFLKNQSMVKHDYTNRELGWVAHIAGKRESRRLLGDHILTENDIVDFTLYPDASVPTSWSIDLHYPDPANTKHFPDNEFLSIAVHQVIHPYPIPYRCLYSRNVDNLFMAGRNISVTHVALGTIRVMRTTGMMGEVVGMAASLATEHNTTPRGVYENHLDELRELMAKGVGKYDMENQQRYNQGGTLGPKE